MVAMEFAVTWPERVQTLVLSDTSPAYERPEYAGDFRERERGIAAMVETIDRYGPLEAGRRAARNESNEFFADGIRRRYANMRREGIVGAAHARRNRRDLTDLLRTTLTMPVLLCMGEEDPVRSALPVMARELPGARQVTIQQTGHGVPAREPGKFVDSLVAFLDDVKAGKRLATVVSL
jgi:pimeloyl-ACP methyl ester carboxylesterase